MTDNVENTGRIDGVGETPGTERVGVVKRLVRVFLCSALVTAGVMMGLTHYKTVSDKNKRAAYKAPSSGGYAEPHRSSSGVPTRKKLVVNGVEFEIKRDYTSESPDVARESFTARKAGLGWERANVAAFASALKLPSAMRVANSPLVYFARPDHMITGALFLKYGSGTQITTVTFDPEGLKAGAHVPSETIPPAYLAVMGARPVVACVGGDAGAGNGLFVCDAPGVSSDEMEKTVRDKLAANGWIEEVGEGALAAPPTPERSGKVIVARKGGAACNIVISERDNGAVAAYRFSHMKRIIPTEGE